MSSSAVVCSPLPDVPICDSLADFESWLSRTFADARVIGRAGSGVRALEWQRGDDRTPSWMDGAINQDRTAIYLAGDPELMSSMAMAVRDLFPQESPVAYTEDWQGIPFDLRRVPDAAALTQAISDGDIGYEWREPSAERLEQE